MAIEYPIEVHGIDCKDSDALKPYNFGTKCGDFVSIKPCGDEYGGKTYLGIFLGSLALSVFVSHNRNTKNLEVEMGMHNPAIFVPDLNKVILGIESWWGKIEDENSPRLYQISSRESKDGKRKIK